MSDIKIEVELVRPKTPIFFEDIIEGFAFASFTSEDDLKVSKII